MHLVERRNEILHCLNSAGSVQVAELAQTLATSEVTIRNDLKYLEQKGALIRFHGGATLPENALSSRLPPAQAAPTTAQTELVLEDRVSIARDPKRRIAVRAAGLVKPGDSIILDSGSTTLNVAEELAKRGSMTVLTNNLPAALALSGNQEITLVLCGGTFRHKTRSFHGAHTEAVLQGVTANILFIGADGIDARIGISTFNEGFAISGVMANAAKKVVAVLDSSKFGRNGFNLVLPIDKIHTLITDDGINDKDRTDLEQQGIEVIIV
ncbi:DeoR/GlpR transcriptional regulator [Sodalis ligni]|jgi:DeoR family galactitol utilization operon repressor|uniref:DeoR/GlpR family DNA-binding transcription regulator n=1 Tax=Sodalis ligni TaxID=2697027 RepID=UPI00193ED6A5|nr:DeoR/GlpR family DNA-binding transcription regulator [Sodalis ligni]QWA12244.1 DeoR/GlpR transcriptional regulator [Sodalis ligni]